ncbi:UvrD-helicase domain-containing protein [Buttiauxella ferragutiae]|uniref:UvrD-helicase domain-containing protein n=1 Tax=Buttiauxella ferragutiae TaxID=82989 RepID=UPI00352360B2
MTPNEIKERKVQEKVIKLVDGFTSFRFNAGAGAGKTYALIETLKYVTINKIIATKSPQKIACITYTNVAVDEINRRLGNSGTVHVSTIHERLWEVIKGAQPQLLICHKEKLIEVIERNKEELKNRDKAKFFVELDEQQKQDFIQYTMQTKDLFYQSKKLSANIFKKSYKNNTEFVNPAFLDKCLSNVEVFKYVAGLLYKKQRLEKCLERINAKQEKRVDYDSRVNTDRLHYMKFSHDTLLEYGLKLVKTYPTLCRIIIDKYPYFFIDEYQDAHRDVIEFIKIIHDYAINNNKKWMVGYFGDTAQCIYDDGVGRNITDIHGGLEDVNKIFNRRSHQQVIDVVNNIRADEIVQVPIVQGKNKGSVVFFHNNDSDRMIIAKKFIDDYKEDLSKMEKSESCTGSENIKVNCLVLTNSLIAAFNDFEDVYNTYKCSTIYYDVINVQVLSQQLEKLHPTVLTIYKLVKLYQDIQESKVSYHDIFGVYSEKMTFSKASLVVHELKTKEVFSLEEWVGLISTLLQSPSLKDTLGKMLMNRIDYDQNEVVSADVFNMTLSSHISNLMNDSAEDDDKAKEKVASVLSLPMTSLINWSNFICGVEVDDVIYHTYHGTKGEEYENVAIILEHSFGSKNRDKFKNYFLTINKDEKEQQCFFSDPKMKKKHVNTKNLLYVACSRAKKNLRVLYLDDISEIKEGIEKVFGPSKPWLTEENKIST